MLADMSKYLAVVPARGGSKRIPRKNIREFAAQPMISWPIRTLIESELFEDIVVSTDDVEVADIAKSYGASVPFIRTAELSDDLTPTVPVIKAENQHQNRKLSLGQVKVSTKLWADPNCAITQCEFMIVHAQHRLSKALSGFGCTSMSTPVITARTQRRPNRFAE